MNRKPKSTLDFEVLIDDEFPNLVVDASLDPTANKRVLSVINDFEDGKWRHTKFQSFLWDNIGEAALSQKERDSLVHKSHSKLIAAAKNLRLIDLESEDVGKGSEVAEILLYGLMKHHYRALPVVPKIFYKQNSNDPVKGADSVHIVIENDDFSLWLGEAKFFTSIEDVRLASIVKSVEQTFATDKLKKENSIITNIGDISSLVNDKELLDRICALLDQRESVDGLKAKLNIPILLLHQCEITQSNTCLTNEYKEKIKKYHEQRAEAYFKKQIKKCSTLHKYEEIKFHIILFPVPSKQIIVNSFVKNANHYKGQSDECI